MAAQVMFCGEATSALNPEMVEGVVQLVADLGAGGITVRPQRFLCQVL
jgi:polar amino acid transport system ATP-binding protein